MTINELKSMFVELYGGDESDIRIFHSPGRVNLIGEHTDYNGGYVFPAALTLGTYIALRKNGTDKLRLRATDLPDFVEVSLDNLESCRGINWGDYQAGTAIELQKSGFDLVGCDMLYHDTLPHGGGLSSSAAIEVSTALALAKIAKEEKGDTTPVDMQEMAFCGQHAEHNFCGVNCGIMDQFASAMGKANHVIFLNCRTMEYELVPLKLDGYKIVISNTNKKHSLASSKYNERRSECEAGLEMLKKGLPDATCLGEISFEELEANKSLITDETVLKRVSHVICEDDRVLRSIEALKAGNIAAFGEYMNQSHDSLRDLYEVTGIELDTLVEEARKIDGVLGSRMTGAGFGGSTVSIVREDKVEEFKEKVGAAYLEKIGYAASFIVDAIGNGGRELY